MRAIVLSLPLLALLAAGCAGASAQAGTPASVSPLLLDFRKTLDEDPTKCAHAWQQVGMHTYGSEVNGMPSLDLCAVLQCVKCGQARHECSRRRR